MTNKDPMDDREYQQSLIKVDKASTAMVSSTDAPPGFLTALSALTATVLTLIGMVSWPVVLLVAALCIPLTLWYFFYMRKRAKPRSVLKPSRAYVIYFLLLLLVMQFIRFWEVSSWAEAGLQWLVIFLIFWGCVTGMRIAWRKDRVREAHESHL